MYNPNYSLGVSLNTTTPKRRYNFDYNLDLMDQNQQLQNLSINAPDNYSSNFGNNYQGLDNYSLLNNGQAASASSDASSATSSAAGDAASAGGGIPWGTIGSIAGGVFNSLPDWYGIDHARESKQAVKAIYGDSSEDPIARFIGGHGTDMANAKSEIRGNTVNFDNVKTTNALLNTWDSNAIQSGNYDYKFGWSNVADNLTAFGKGASIGAQFGGGWGALIGGIIGGASNIFSQLGGSDRAEELEHEAMLADTRMLSSRDAAERNIRQRNNRIGLMYSNAEGGSLEDLNGVTTFNVGGTHEQNPYGGIQQGIASDGLPNTVEEGEVKYKDYIYSNRLKPSKTLIKDNNLPEKYAGLTYAEMAEKLQKESEDRPNDPISKQTLEDWMSRLQSAQETQKAQIEERKLAKASDSMSTEDKAMLMNSLLQQQEGIDLSQPMYAEGGKIHIAPSKKGTFTAAATKHGKSVQEFARQVLANKENYSPAMVKKANFARNAAKWHKGAYGLNLDIPPYLDGDGEPEYPVGTLAWFNQQGTPEPIVGHTKNGTVDLTFRDTTPMQYMPAMVQPVVTPEIAQLSYDPSELENAITAINEEAPAPVKKSTNKGQTKGQTKGANFDTEKLRYAPAVGAGIGALVATMQPVDYTLANEYRNLASKLNPLAAPHIGGYRRYTPYDINLGDAENLALEAAALRASRGQNRATQAAQNIATINAFQKAKAQRNLAAQQANEANRLAVDTYNLGIDQFNAQRDTQYDQLNQQILNTRLNMLAQAAQAADASRTARANMINTTGTNFFNQLGNVGQDEWNRNQYEKWLSQHEAVKNIMDDTTSKATKTKKLKDLGYTEEQIKQIEELYR